ncbi:MAG: pyruvate kinase [Planctomycetes bacterium]|jgi:pyruvate kinase|nr:pyruvate kinase [Planctomycetota bacterium]MDP6423999.1 pyruvate kinase [Planctomycetota bacterium]
MARARRLPTRTKIVATVGPSVHGLTKLRSLVRAGVDVLRVNFSHGTHADHAAAIRDGRRAAKLEERPLALLADLQGPKIRVGDLEGDEPILLKRGERFVIVADESVVGHAGRVGCSYADLARDVHDGDRILLDDGSLELEVRATEGKEVVTRVRYGGLLWPHKGINLPGTAVTAPSLGKKDLADLAFAVEAGVDYVALSFVRNADEVERLRRRIAKLGSDALVIAKIERAEAVERIESIVEAADGIMVARGDMGVELGAESVPGIQKRLIRVCIAKAKPVITATQMLETMRASPRPTRAEASDVANAIYDGTSALMLSAETATGKYPVLAVRTMDRIARRTESEIFARGSRHPSQRVGDTARRQESDVLPIADVAVAAAAKAARDGEARIVCVFTETGRTARLLARERLGARLIAFTPTPRTYQRLALHWGIVPLLTRKARTIAQMYEDADELLVDTEHAQAGDRAVFLAGTVQVAGATNTVTIREL